MKIKKQKAILVALRWLLCKWEGLFMFCFVLVWFFCFCFCFVFWFFFFFFFWWEGVKNIHEISRSVRCKNREKYAPKKTIIQDNIYVIQQIAYVHGVAGISPFTGKKIQDMAIQFSFSKTTWNPIHRLSLKKSPIKNCSNFISSRVIIQIKHN